MKITAALVAFALAGGAGPALAAADVSGKPAAQPADGAVMQKLTRAEMRSLAQKYPAQTKRMREVTGRADAVAYRIYNWHSDKCLAIGSSSTANGANAIQWDCIDSNAQFWYADDDLHILNFNSGKYLAIGSSSTANGAKAIQWDYTGSDGQRWYGDNDHHIINLHSGKYLAIGSSSTDNGAKAIQWDYTGSDGQRWY
ncbi:hypothetical protein BG418_12880 [Streptomyces sp. CBMA152]|nr:hypothetical protein [Streptomyces sp. CBMA152]